MEKHIEKLTEIINKEIANYFYKTGVTFRLNVDFDKGIINIKLPEGKNTR